MAFVQIEKTAGTSLITLLRNSLGIRHMEVRTLDKSPGAIFSTPDFSLVARVSPWIRSICGHEIVEPTKHLPERIRPYTILRNPVDRALSHFEDMHRRGRKPPTLEEYLADPANRNFQIRKIAGEEDFEKAKRLLAEEYFFVGLKEHFDESIRVFGALSPWPLELKYRVSHLFSERGLRKRLRQDPDILRRFGELNEGDAELHAWTTRVLYPELKRKANNPSSAPLPTLPLRRHSIKYLASRFWQRGIYRYSLKLARLFR